MIVGPDEQEVDADPDTDVFEAAEAGVESEEVREWVTLPPATLLTIEQADALLRRRRARLITVIGERNGGKTTLVTEVYERFLQGPYADFLFAQSLSLIGFEQKTFQSRARSRAQTPDTPRTSSRDGLRFFHLGVFTKQSKYRMDLLISERAGESYREARDRPSLLNDLVEIQNADIIVLILDGDRVSQPRVRAEAFASVRDILQAINDSSVTTDRIEVQLITTKEDLFISENRDRLISALEEFENQIVASFATSFAGIRCFRVAARDPTGRLPPASGLEPILASWLTPFVVPTIPSLAVPSFEDEFDRLATRRLRDGE